MFAVYRSLNCWQAETVFGVPKPSKRRQGIKLDHQTHSTQVMYSAMAAHQILILRVMGSSPITA